MSDEFISYIMIIILSILFGVMLGSVYIKNYITNTCIDEGNITIKNTLITCTASVREKRNE